MGEHPLITVSGPPGSGTTTLAKHLQERVGFRLLSGGDIFREMAKEQDMTLPEFTNYAEENDDVDRLLDRKLKSKIEKHLAGHQDTESGLVVESRLAGWHARGKADLAVLLKAPVEVRIERVDESVESTDQMVEREQSEARRYKEYYDIDISEYSVYDIVIDTEQFSARETVELVEQALVSTGTAVPDK